MSPLCPLQPTLRYGSVCSGIEAASVAWHPLGWEASFLSEIEAFPRAVLQHHYPTTPLHGDFTTIQAGDYDAIDLLVGGTPCQSFSVAGLRGGLADERGNLALEYLRLADRLRPRWLVWENVPGVLSSGGGRDFGSFLGGLVQLGYGFAYRVLDAQFFGLAQRRKRVFVVGYLGDWRRAAAVLFEPASLRGHPAPRRKAGQVAANALTERPDRGGGNSEGQRLIAPPLTHNPYGDHESREGLLIAFDGQNVACHDHVAGTLDSGGAHSNRGMHIAHALRAEGFDASEDGTGRGTPLVPVAFDTTQITSVANRCNPQPGDPCHPLAAGAHAPAVAFDWYASQRQSMPVGQACPPIKTTMQPAVSFASAVRRLTPRECERLQGFPNDYTLIPYRGKPAADGPRYRALGNSMPVPVMRWIGRRIDAQEAAIVAERAHP